MIKKVLTATLSSLDSLYLYFDKRLIRRTKNLRLIPVLRNRQGGKRAYGEWCYVVGVFQTLLFHHLNKKTNNRILDVGCGTGILGIASKPFLGKGGGYLGIDVSKKAVEFCRSHYPEASFSFKHLDVVNPKYAPEQANDKKKWDVTDKSIDMVTALSVWTHLNEEDAIFYFREIDRVLKPGGRALVTFFLLDDHYYDGLKNRSDIVGEFHNTNQNRWVFDTLCSNSRHWFHPQWVEQPEDAIGIKPSGIDMMLERTNLKSTTIYIGNWKGIPGIFFQDVLVFEKE
jgi:SAM-dependent methyltransferase